MFEAKMECAASPALRQRVAELLQEKKMVMLTRLAEICGVSEQCAAEALPEEMRAFAAGECFDALWEEVTRWENATFIMQHGGSVVEIKGRIPAGKHGGGYFNLEHGLPLGGHIASSKVARLCFLSLPFMGLESHSVQFFDVQGAVLFAVYVGREQRTLIPAARESFFRLREQMGNVEAA